MTDSKNKKPLDARTGLEPGAPKTGQKTDMMTVEILENLDKYYNVASGRKGNVLSLPTKLAKVLIEDKKAKEVRG